MKAPRPNAPIWPTLALLLLMAPSPRTSGTFIVFGPKDYERHPGNPVSVSSQFAVPNPHAGYLLRIFNGGRDGQFTRVSSAVVTLNGTQVIAPGDFGGSKNEPPQVIERPVALAAANTLVVEVRGAPGSGMTIEIEGTVSAPLAISNLIAPSAVPFGSALLVTFDYADEDGDITVLDLTRANAIEQVAASLPAAALGIHGTMGHVSLPLASDDLAFGANSFSLQLKDAGGHTSEVVTFTVDVAGLHTGGTAPALTGLATGSTRWNRPVGAIDLLRPPFTWSYNDADADILLVRERQVRPDGSVTVSEARAASRNVEGASGTLTSPFFTFRAADLLGVYRVELTLIDAGGRLSNTVAHSIELVGSGGEPPLSITGFDPLEGAAGTQVRLNGSGFDGTDLSTNRVEINGSPVSVTSAGPSTLMVIIPEHAGSGRFVVRNKNGVAASDGTFMIPSSIEVSPQAAELVSGGSIRFEAAAFSASANAVTWSVDGVAGGSAAVGLISTDGRYTAPQIIPPAGYVTVSAALTSDSSVTSSSQVAIVPPPPRPGHGRVLATTGGRVLSADGRALVSFPPGALAADSDITVSALYGDALPAPRPNRRVVGAVRLGPSPLQFNTPVAVMIPLTRY